MDIKNIMSRALLLIGRICIFLGLCNVFYIGNFLRNSHTLFPVEILFSVIFVLVGVVLDTFSMSKRESLDVTTFYRKLRESVENKTYLDNAKKMGLISFFLLVTPTAIDGSHTSRFQFTNSYTFYLFSTFLFLLMFWLSITSICFKKFEISSK